MGPVLPSDADTASRVPHNVSLNGRRSTSCVQANTSGDGCANRFQRSRRCRVGRPRHNQRGRPIAQAIAIDASVNHDMRHVDSSGPYSRAMLCAVIRSPALAAAKCAKPGLPPRLAEAPAEMIVPWPRGASRRAASRPTRKPPKQPTRHNASTAAAESSRKSICWLPP